MGATPTAGIVSLMFPPTCVLCGAPGCRGRDLCAGCAADLPTNRDCCPRCALPLDRPLPPGSVCGVCARRPPPYDRCIAALRYETPVPTLVGAAKFRGRLASARLLGELLADAVLVRALAPPQVVVPVPLHPSRLAHRGYNQAVEIARAVGRELGLPLDTCCCARASATPPQTGLDEAARRRNVRGAFVVRGTLPWARVAILDDVVTTGSTVAELSRALRRAGAREIEVWAAARTV
jgi:ComF family protein